MQHGRRAFITAVGAAAATAGVTTTAGLASSALAEPSETASPTDSSNTTDTRALEARTQPAHPAQPAHPDRPRPLDPPTRALLAGLDVGARLGAFTLIAAHAPFHGAVPLVFERDGARVQIDVMARGAGPTPMAETASLALFAHDTDAASGEELGALAHALARALDATDVSPATLGLLSHAERRSVHAWGVFSVID